MAAAGVPVLPELDPAGGDRGATCRCWSRRAPGAAGAACGSCATLAELPRAVDRRPAPRPSVGLRRPDRVLRALRRGRPAHRGAGARRRARHGVVAGGARVLAAAPAPEGGRGDAVPDGRRRPARPSCRPRPWRRRRRSTTSAPAPWSSSRRRRRHASGSSRPTPGCRSSTRSPSASPGWTWSPSSCGSPRGSGCRARRRSRSGAAIEVRLYAEDPAQGWRPAGGTVAPLRRPRGACGVRRAPPGRASGWTPASSTARVVGTSYDPMLAKVIAWAPTRAEAAARLAAALAGAQRARPGHQPRPAGAHAPAPRVPRRPHRHRLLRPDRAGRPRRSAGRPGRASSSPRSPAPWPAPPRGAATPGCSGSCRAGGGTSRPSSQRAAFDHAGETVEVGYRHARQRRCWSRAATTSSCVSATPDEVVLEVAGVEHRLGGGAGRRHGGRRRATAGRCR